MKYELFLRRERPLDDDELAAIAARVALAPELGLDVFRDEAGRARGVDLALDTAAATGERTLCDAAFALAAAHGLAVYDPQLAASVSEADRARVAGRFTETAAYAEGTAIATLGASSARGLAPGVRVWVYVGAAIVALLLLGRALRCALP